MENNSSLIAHNSQLREGYSELKIHHSEIKTFIFSHPEFVQFSKEMDDLFTNWKVRNTNLLKGLTIGIKPKLTIFRISEDVLKTYTGKPLMDKYAVYQHLMNYWNDIMQDDCYLITADGWKAEPSIIKQTRSATVWDCDLVPKTLLIDRYFLREKKAIEQLEADKEAIAGQITEMEEEHNVEDGFFADLDKVNKATISGKLKVISAELKQGKLSTEEKTYNSQLTTLLNSYLNLIDNQANLNKKIKEASANLDKKVIERYRTLTEDEIKQLVVDDKWMASIERSVKTEMERISQRLTQRIRELAERYESTLPVIEEDVLRCENKVKEHLKKMGY